MKLVKARNSDSKELTALTIRSKAHWGYSDEQISKWEEDLTIYPEYIDQNEVYKLLHENQLIGYYSFIRTDAKAVKLDNMFLEPNYIGQGLGKVMMSHLFQQVSNLGGEMIRLDSEPNADGFYHKLGFVVIDRLESSIPGRYLPIMELKLNLTTMPFDER